MALAINNKISIADEIVRGSSIMNILAGAKFHGIAHHNLVLFYHLGGGGKSSQQMRPMRC
jgi:hypothetical protein